MVSAALTNRRLRIHDGPWLYLAIVLHALVLAIPLVQKPLEKPVAQTVQISLLARQSPEKPFVEMPEKTGLETPVRQPEAEHRTIAQQAEMVEPEELIEKAPASPDTILSTARLLDSASQFDWPGLQAEKPLQLGIHTPRPMPENWRIGISVVDNLFNGMVAPRQTEIVDRWLTADGSHNVVINTPTGDTLCGRALPWNPMQPLVEHVMQFRRCGGGGKRSFTMPQRVSRTADTIGMANSTTN